MRFNVVVEVNNNNNNNNKIFELWSCVWFAAFLWCYSDPNVMDLCFFSTVVWKDVCAVMKMSQECIM